jgi:hypothetical protein
MKTKIHFESQAANGSTSVLSYDATRIEVDLVIVHDGNMSTKQKENLVETIKTSLNIIKP